MGAETVEYAGRAVVYMAADTNIMKKSGRVMLTTDLGNEYGFVDVNGKTPVHVRALTTTLCLKGNVWLASMVPKWVKIPFWVLALSMSKF